MKILWIFQDWGKWKIIKCFKFQSDDTLLKKNNCNLLIQLFFKEIKKTKNITNNDVLTSSSSKQRIGKTYKIKFLPLPTSAYFPQGRGDHIQAAHPLLRHLVHSLLIEFSENLRKYFNQFFRFFTFRNVRNPWIVLFTPKVATHWLQLT